MIDFCRFTEKDEQFVREVLNTCFSFKDYSQIAAAYNFFSKNYYQPERHNPLVIDRSAISLRTDQFYLKKNLSNSEYWAGIDLPILLTKEARSSKTIFIVGEDPLRRTANENIELGTPYGTHLESNRTGRQRLYWEIAVKLIESGYNVYYTDIKKLWLKHFESKQKVIFPADVQNYFKEALQLELEYFEPAVIITYGVDAAKAMREIGIYTHKVISFLHPSWQANKEWRKVLSKWLNNDVRATHQHKVDFILSSIGEFI